MTESESARTQNLSLQGLITLILHDVNSLSLDVNESKY